MRANGFISRQSSNYEYYYFKNLYGDVVYAFTSGKWCSSRYDTQAFGKELDSYDYFSSNPNLIRYAGEYYDTETGMAYLRTS